MSDRHWLLIQAWDNLPEVLGTPVARRAGPDDETGRGLEIGYHGYIVLERWATGHADSAVGEIIHAVNALLASAGPLDVGRNGE